MSWMRYMTLYSFRQLHPDWQMDLYYDDKPISLNAPYLKKPQGKEPVQDFHKYNNGLDYSPNLKDLNINVIKWDTEEVNISKFYDITPSGKSNIFKWHQLYKYGGIYSDMDVLYFKPIDELYNQWNADNTNVVITQSQYLSIGLMASTPENEFFRDIFKHTFKFTNHNNYQTYGVMTIYDLYKGIQKSQILETAEKRYPSINFSNLPMHVLYYFNHKDIDKCFNNANNINIFHYPQTSIGYHWYAGGVSAQNYNNLLNHMNYKNYDVLFSKLCKNYFPDINTNSPFFVFTGNPTKHPLPSVLYNPIPSLDPPANAGIERPQKLYSFRHERKRK
jgi:mannosyltransferase OCH1-like enzyme